jgi:hypothetical protein
MTAVPADYSVAAIVSLTTKVDNDATRGRSAEVDRIGDIIMSDDPQVTAEQKMAAIGTLRSMGRDSRAIGAQDALIKASWFVTESPFAKAMDAAGAAFSAETTAAGRTGGARDGDAFNAPRMNLDTLSRRSSTEQTLIAYNMGYASLDTFKGELERQADDHAARYPAAVVKVTLSDDAKASLGDAQQALETLQRGKTGDVMATAALSLLQNTTETRGRLGYAPGNGLSRRV